MNRRGFLRNIGFAGAAIAAAPLVSFVPIPKRLIYKIDLPVFSVFYTDGTKNVSGKLIVKSMFRMVQTYKGTIKQLCDRYPNDEIFFYKEETDVIDIKFECVRACVLKKEPNMKILIEPKYKV